MTGHYWKWLELAAKGSIGWKWWSNGKENYDDSDNANCDDDDDDDVHDNVDRSNGMVL